MKVTFISTFYNEEKSLIKFLNSISSQSLQPSEIVLVDAYSTDNTFEIIQNWADKISSNKVSIKLIRKKGNRSIGRNTAIKQSTYNFIACSDAGCILDKNWLREIVTPFKKKYIDVVAGYYKPRYSNTFQKSLAAYTCVPLDKVTDDFLPSSRSIAFTKNAWKKVGGYPEELDTCEDLVFARKLRNRKYKFIVKKTAFVHWKQKKNISEAFMQFFNYAKGDGEALYFRFQTPFMFVRVLITVLLFQLAVTNFSSYYLLFLAYCLFYVSWSILKNYKYVGKVGAFIYLPLLQMSSDIAVSLGMTIGMINRLMRE